MPLDLRNLLPGQIHGAVSRARLPSQQEPDAEASRSRSRTPASTPPSVIDRELFDDTEQSFQLSNTSHASTPRGIGQSDPDPMLVVNNIQVVASCEEYKLKTEEQENLDEIIQNPKGRDYVISTRYKDRVLLVRPDTNHILILKWKIF